MTEPRLVEMRYLKACQKESARIVPVVPAVSRLAQTDIVLHGYHVPRGTVIVQHIALPSNSSEFFHKPDQFLPERWIRGASR